MVVYGHQYGLKALRQAHLHRFWSIGAKNYSTKQVSATNKIVSRPFLLFFCLSIFNFTLEICILFSFLLFQVVTKRRNPIAFSSTNFMTIFVIFLQIICMRMLTSAYFPQFIFHCVSGLLINKFLMRRIFHTFLQIVLLCKTYCIAQCQQMRFK